LARAVTEIEEEQPPLDFDVLDHGFDHEVDRGGRFQRFDRGDRRQGLAREIVAELAFRDQLVEGGLQGCPGVDRGARPVVEQQHRVARLRRHLGDTAAHDAGADD
jgi:hypothetical protein